MKILGVIPARYASTRFPAKPLVDIAGTSMIMRVYNQVKACNFISEVVVATDNELIYNHVQSFGANVVMTSESHQSGTDRVYEAYQNYAKEFDYIINIQGDEPFIKPEQIALLANCLDGKTEIATLCKKLEDIDAVFDENKVKVVFDNQNNALYFSRQVIPFVRGKEKSTWLNYHDYFKHLGIYAFRTDILSKITKLEMSSFEKSESLEQLRWLQNGYSIKVLESQWDSVGVDTPEDLEFIFKNLI